MRIVQTYSTEKVSNLLPRFGGRINCSTAEGRMTEEGLNRIAGGLAITVPAAYRELMLARGEEFRASQLGSLLWARANDVIIENLRERDPRCSLYDPYPKWWKEYLLIGTTEDNDYFCLRLNGDPAVYKIGSDDSGPEKVAKSLAAFLNTKLIKPLLAPPTKHPCACCGCLTVVRGKKHPSNCPVCWWRDDEKEVTLSQARVNYKKVGVFLEDFKMFVRPPKPEELPSS